MLIGGRVHTILSGGAPLSENTHEYLRNILGVNLTQGYGLTETNACATVQFIFFVNICVYNILKVMLDSESSVGRVGPPVQGVKIKLVNWEEGNYLVSDKPFPRGEIYVGGGNVAAGYYNNEVKTHEEFFNDKSGMRWFRTGDIGEFDSDGTLKIVDRKKDLVKLQHGEYVSPGRVESILKGCPVVGNVCVFGESQQSFVVAVICPVKEILEDIALKISKPYMKLEELVKDVDITKAVLKEVQLHSENHGLMKFETPREVSLTDLEWIPETGLVTAAMKLKRQNLAAYYNEDIKNLYSKMQN